MTTTTQMPKCFQKIELTSSKYLRRLAKEINARAYNGVYIVIGTLPHGESRRVIGAMYSPSTSTLRVKTIESDMWFPAGPEDCFDDCGNQIWASTTECGR